MTGTIRPRAWLARTLGPWVNEVDAGVLRTDALAGLLGAVLALPQAIAFASLAGLPPAWGLYTAVVPCIVAALAGSSRLVMSGPTNAVSLALAAMLAPLATAGSPDYLRLALVVTLCVGLTQAALALLRLGRLAHFISPSVMLGFTSGAAVLIALHAIAGLRQAPPALALAGVTLALAWGGKRLWARGPFLLLALAAGTLVGALLAARGVALERVGALPQAWPAFQVPPLHGADLPRLAGITLALTVVALGQSIAIAKLMSARTGQPLDVNRECLGQGLSNVAGAFFSCFLASGSLNRSLPNLDSGARTPLAAVFSGALVLALAGLAAPLIAAVPLAAIAGLLLWVAISLVDVGAWRHALRLDRGEAAIAGATGAATLLLPLQEAVLGGVGLSLLSYLYRTSRPALRTMGFAAGSRGDPHRPMVVLDAQPQPECPQLKMLRMEGSVYFGAVAHVAEHLHALRQAPHAPRHLLVMTKSMNFIDYAGAAMWEEEHLRRLAMGGDLYFHRPRPEVLQTWQRRGFVERLGADHVFADKRTALATIVPRLDAAVCAQCRVRAFEECAARPAPSEAGAEPGAATAAASAAA